MTNSSWCTGPPHEFTAVAATATGSTKSWSLVVAGAATTSERNLVIEATISAYTAGCSVIGTANTTIANKNAQVVTGRECRVPLKQSTGSTTTTTMIGCSPCSSSTTTTDD